MIRLLIVLLCLPVLTFSQEEGTEEVFTYNIDVEPSFPGGEKALMEFISKNMVYPKDAMRNGEQGIVYVQFVVLKTGDVADVRILRGVSESIDKEVLRLMGIMPKWVPGEFEGKPVKVAYTLPLTFRLG